MTPAPERYRFSIIIPVLHEAELINPLLERLDYLKTNQPVEVIVVDGSPTKDTLAVISKKTVKKYSTLQGRGRQMNLGAAHASGDILVFLHADTLLPTNALVVIQETLQNTNLVGGAFTLQIQSKKRLLHMIAVYSTLRSRLTRAPYGDQVIFLRKTYFDSLGGFQEIPLMEDVELMRRIKKKKGKIIILSTPVVTSERRWNQEGLLYTAIRDTMIIFLYWCGMPAEKLARFYPWKQPSDST
ncbi:MAG: TIGR04283 family arsenosugar biosynthesis glycosyltransferase [Candidatus Thermoplasmatota archaeon]|nr:TIGR04283 family arsenosugar biosynthesis glycosyltransferase [Candidatus Thermoplasmatota archaeon]